jgi:hypothetical protein
MGQALLSIKGSSRQSFREVSETIPGLKSQVKRGIADPERVVPGNPAGKCERPGGKIHRCGRDRSGAHGPSWVLRAILLNVLFKQANAQTQTAEEMQRLIDRAD